MEGRRPRREARDSPEGALSHCASLRASDSEVAQVSAGRSRQKESLAASPRAPGGLGCPVAHPEGRGAIDTWFGGRAPKYRRFPPSVYPSLREQRETRERWVLVNSRYDWHRRLSNRLMYGRSSRLAGSLVGQACLLNNLGRHYARDG